MDLIKRVVGYGYRLLTIPKLPKISERHIVKNHDISIIYPDGRAGNVMINELVIINSIIKAIKPERIFEIGTFDGRTTLNMAESSPKNCEILTLDLPSPETQTTFEERKRDLEFTSIHHTENRITTSRLRSKKKIIQLYEDSATFNFSPYYNSVDVVFIDGAHSFEYVVNDTLAALKLLRDGRGVILWHDYARGSQVAKAIHYLQKQNILSKKVFNVEFTCLAAYANGVLDWDPSQLNFTKNKERQAWEFKNFSGKITHGHCLPKRHNESGRTQENHTQ